MTEDRSVQIETSVDATGARAGFNEVSRGAGTMAASVARSSQQAEGAIAGVGNGANTSARNVDAAQRNLIGSIQRTTAALEAGSRSGSAYYEVLARQRGVDPAVLEPYLAQLRAIETAQTRASAANTAGAASLGRVGVSAAQTAAALRGVPAQFTDIVTSLQGGQAPLTVLLQQGGQLRDMFGSVGGAARALGSYVLDLVNPFTAAAAGVGVLAFAYIKGRDEANAFNVSLITSGNVAGTTADQMSEMARSISQISGSRGAAAAVLNGLVQTGRVQAQNLQGFAQSVVDAERIMGQSVEQTTAEFDKLGKAPLQGLNEVNAKFHNVTAAIYEQVKALQDQGRYAEAANVAQQAYADGITKNKQAVLDSLTDWERGWIRVKDGISGAIDAVLHLRESTANEKITNLLKDRADIEENMRRARARGLAADVAAYQAELDANKRSIDTIRDRVTGEKDVTAAKAAGQRADELRNKWLGESDVLLTKQQRLQRDINAARVEGLANGLSEEEILKRQTVIRRQNYDVVVEGISRQIAAIERLSAVEDIRSQRRNLQTSASRAAGDITEDQAIQKIADEDIAAINRRITDKQAELAKLQQKFDSKSEQDAASGDIEQLREKVLTRQTQLEIDLTTARRNRGDESNRLATSGLVAAQAELAGMVAQTKAQTEYNEEIGLSSSGLMRLRSNRTEHIALLKEETAAEIESIRPGAALAQTYRDQAAELRKTSAAEREGFFKSRDPWANLTASVKQYGDAASNVGGQIGDAMTNAFRGAEDAFVTFVTTGKLSFKSLATSILSDIARIEARKAIAGLVTTALDAGAGFFGGSFGPGTIGDLGGARANGGPVTGGTSYLVGERGPEIFTPSNSGAIIPNHAIGGSVNISLTTNVSSSGSTTQASGDNGSARAAADALNTKMKEVIARETRQGGIIWNLQQGRA